MRRIRVLALTALLAVALTGIALAQTGDAIYQVSVINALMEGVYDGDVTFGELTAYGDFGLGTVTALDGEVVAVDGRFYQVRDDGVAYELPDDATTPFAAVTFFVADQSVWLEGQLSQDEVQKYLMELMETQNVPYAIRITGHFNHVLVRSVAIQTPPYRRLADSLAEQVEFELTDVRGTMVGFWLPGYLEGVNVPGFHLHFIDEARAAGGHVLGFELEQAQIELDAKDLLQVVLPIEDEAFRSLNFAQQSGEELARIENVSVNQ